MKKLAVLLLSASMLVGCQSAYYAAAEKVGYAKRDILVDRVESARDAQVEAKGEITDALTEFRKVVSFGGGELEVRYQSLAAQLQHSEDAADSVSSPLGEAVGRRRKYARCGVSQQTALLNKTGARKPSRQALRPFVLHRDGRVLGPEWREWAVHKDKLVSPEGQETTQSQLNAYWLVMQRACELTEKDPKGRQEFYRILAAV